MTIKISALRWVPSFAQGYVRDLWVRWALEEAGLPYEVILIDGTAQASDSYRAWQPFGHVPAYRDGKVELFESGAIVLHIAAQFTVLAPADEPGRARVASWVFAAMNSIGPQVHTFLDLCSDEDIPHKRRADIEANLKQRLAALSAWLGTKAHLENDFTAGDLMIAGVLRELVESGVLAAYPNLDRHRARCEGRPAFGRALEAQMATFRENAPG